MMVGKPGEGKPRHSISLDLPVVPDLEWRGLPSPGYLSLDRPVVPEMEWRGLPSPGSPTASSRLVHVFERYWPQAAKHGVCNSPDSLSGNAMEITGIHNHGYILP